MDEYYSDNQPELIHCEFCGEDYAATYRVCPFCNTAPNGKKVKTGSKGRAGDRVRTNTRGGGYGGAKSPLAVVGIILAVLLIVAAAIIVAFLVKSTISGMNDDLVETPSSSVTSQEDAEIGGETGSQEEDSMLEGPIPPDSLTLDQPTLSLAPGGNATLVSALTPTNWVGQVIWATSDPNVATVDANGNVTAVGVGSCTITASAAGVTAESAVTVAEAQVADPAASTIVVSCYGNEDVDFTIKQGESVPLKVSGGDGENYTFAIADAGVASISSEGNTCTVQGVAKGKTTLTITSGMEKVEIIIRTKEA